MLKLNENNIFFILNFSFDFIIKSLIIMIRNNNFALK
jgi:hypothetical protein